MHPIASKIIELYLKLFRSLQYSIYGIKSVWMTEQSFRLEIYVCLVVMPVALLVPFANVIKLLLILLLLLLLTFELINTAIEAVVDRVSLDIHPQSRLAKDASCAAVGVVILINLVAWIYAFATLI